MSTRQDIVSALVAALQAEAPAGVAVHRHAMRPIEKDELPALVVYLTDARPKPNQGRGLREYELPLRIEARATGREVDVALDPLIGLAQRVMLRVPCFSDRVLSVEEGACQYDALALDRCYCAAALDWTVTFVDDPTGQGPDPWNQDLGGPLTEVTP